MPKAEDTVVIIELTEHSLHALRAVNGAVEAGGECIRENKAALEALLDSVAPSRKTEGLRATASVWPNSVAWHVATDTEAMLDRTRQALQTIAAAALNEPTAPFSYAACNAGDGGPVTEDGTDKWVLASALAEARAKSAATLNELKIVADDVAPAGFAAIEAISRALRLEAKGGAVALWDLGSERSSLILVTEKGAEAVAPCAVGMEKVFEAVQAALKLKFRGAGARLFFNDGYDFTEPGPKVGAAVGPGLRAAIGELPTLADPPALACLGLTARQAWFVRESATAAGINAWAPDLGKLAADLGLRFSDESLGASFSAASVGLFSLLGSRIAGREAWSPEWTDAEPPAEETAPAPEPVEEPEPEPIERPVVKPAAPPARPKPSLAPEPSGPQMTFSAKPARPPVAPPRQVAAPPIPTQAPHPGSTRPPVAAPPVRMSAPSPSAPPPSFPAPGPSPSHAAFPAPAPAMRPPSFPTGPGFPAPGGAPKPEVPHATRPPSFSAPGFPMPTGASHAPPGGAPPPPPPGRQAPTQFPPAPSPSDQAGGAPPTPAVTALPFEAVKIKSIAAAPVAAQGSKPAPPKSRVGFYVGVGVVASLVFAAIAVVLEARLEKIKAMDLEQQEATAHHVVEQQLKEAERSAKEQEERDLKDKEAAVEAARREAAEETRREVLAEVEKERLSKLPGIFVVATDPAGASVSIDGGPAVLTPARVEGIAPGNHRVKITLAGHESADLNAEIRGSKVTDAGTITLSSIYGSVALSSSPDNLEFEIRAADNPSGPPVRTGRTPASFDDIARGSYVVTFRRPGCRDHTENVSVEKGAKLTVQTKYLDGALELSSDPSGANVTKDGAFLGTTPLSLRDLTPKLASFELTLPGYDPTPVSCQIPEGDTLKYSARLLRKDRVFTQSEVKTPPTKIESPPPSLSASQKKMGAEVVLSIVVRRDGTVTGIEVVRSTDDDISRRCVSAVERWTYNPATAPDGRVVEARIEVPFNFPAGAQ